MIDGLNINIMLIVLALAVIFKIVDGFKKGMVKEIISLISMVVLCLVVALLANGVSSYLSGKVLTVIVVVLLLGLLGIVHHLLGVVFFSAKMLTKLPVIHSADKLLGIVFGVVEVILVLWTVYTFIMMMDLGMIGQVILSYTEDSSILLWLYQHNYLAYWVEHLLEEFNFVPLTEIMENFGLL